MLSPDVEDNLIEKSHSSGDTGDKTDYVMEDKNKESIYNNNEINNKCINCPCLQIQE
jgi:hypothetical protein